MITCRMLGPVEVTVDGHAAPPELLWRKHLALLVYLACSPNQSRHRAHLVALLWGDRQEQAARHSLNEALRVLRRCAGDGAVMTDGDAVRLEDGWVQTDLAAFDLAAAEERWSDAGNLVGGEFMEGFEVPGCPDLDAWLSAERSTWRRRGVDALLRQAEALSGQGDVEGALAVAETALTLDPMAEAAMSMVLRCLALTGNRSGALARYAEYRERLDEHLGIEPAGDLEHLAERIRAGRVAMEPPSAPREAGESDRRAPLIGRGAELASLLHAWNETRQGEGASLLAIEGDGGTGKSRLLLETTSRARLDGAAVIGFRAVEGDRQHPLQGLTSLASDALLGVPGIAGASPEALSAFAQHIPEWADRFPPTDNASGSMTLSTALADVCRAVMAESPLLVAVDDFHWLDGDSAAALLALLRDLRDDPFALAVTTTASDTPESLDRVRASIGRDVPGAVVRLEPWNPQALTEAARWYLPQYSGRDLDRLVRRLATDSAGLPFLAVELLHAVALGLDLLDRPATWPGQFRTLESTLPGDLPDAVRAAIRMGFRRLPKESQTILAALAVLGDRVTAGELAQATHLDTPVVADALDQLEWQRWILGDAMGYTFPARLVRQIVAEDMVMAGQRARILEAVPSRHPG